jgi:hypothetical protein
MKQLIEMILQKYHIQNFLTIRIFLFDLFILIFQKLKIDIL